MGSRPGIRKRPTIEREKLYRLVLELRKQGLSYNGIIKRIETDRGVTLRKSHISGWLNGKHEPFGYVRAFDPTPTPDLAYVIGVSLGDGSTSSNRNHSHMIKLRVIDKEFAEEFARCLGMLLNRSPPLVKWREKTRSWHTQVSSLLLQKFLRQSLDQLKSTIEFSSECTAAFLRGFFDSEGWVYKSQLGVVNTDKELLLYVSHLLALRFDIESFPPSVSSKGGRIVLIKGKFYNANKDCYNVSIAKASLLAFQARVGFTIIRRQQRLAAAIG